MGVYFQRKQLAWQISHVTGSWSAFVYLRYTMGYKDVPSHLWKRLFASRHWPYSSFYLSIDMGQSVRSEWKHLVKIHYWLNGSSSISLYHLWIWSVVTSHQCAARGRWTPQLSCLNERGPHVLVGSKVHEDCGWVVPHDYEKRDGELWSTYKTDC